jgi:tetrahydromethanopterin S-methyltransferase subunit G
MAKKMKKKSKDFNQKKFCSFNKLSPRALGLSMGIIFGLIVFIMGLAETYLGYGAGFVNLFVTLYPGFKAGFIGSIIGGLWGLVDGFVCGILIAWVYNKLV